MSYQVLARKWRPRNFQEMVGQEPILRMLMNALEHQRLHHAYLFTGTRGVGKTTLARILAKCLNCESGITSKPCGTCSVCQSIDQGKFLDLIEIDAASRTKVEDTREILDNVQYAPTQGRYKVYLIDEVHMLSGHSFNALLKTLEEPPAHVKFLLATTDPKRLPVTILSRCLQFNLKRVPQEQIAQHLQHICTTENIPWDAPALDTLAKAADGSMRDALSLLDQTIAYCGEKVTALETRTMLGTIEQDVIFRLLHALADHNGNQLLAEITTLAEQAPNFSQVLEELISTLHQISLCQAIPSARQYHESVTALATRFTAEETQLFYQIALHGRRDLILAPHPQMGFEMTMLRMLAFLPTTEKAATVPVTSNNVKTIDAPSKPQPAVSTPATVAVTALPANDWKTILSQLELNGLAQALASNCVMSDMNDAGITLILAPKHEAMLNAKLAERIEQALTRYFNQPRKLHIKIAATSDTQTPAQHTQQVQTEKLQAATTAITNDVHVKKMLDMFDATLDVDSIKSVDSIS